MDVSRDPIVSALHPLSLFTVYCCCGWHPTKPILADVFTECRFFIKLSRFPYLNKKLFSRVKYIHATPQSKVIMNTESNHSVGSIP